MMNSLTSNRLVAWKETIASWECFGFVQQVLYTSVESHSELEYSHILSENELKEPKKQVLCASKNICFGKGNVLLA
jgi:hypothetical protein